MTVAVADAGESALAAARRRCQADLVASLPRHLQRLSWTAAQVAAHQRDALRRLLAQAKAQSPFHARRLRHVDPDGIELTDLARLPTMTKAEMMAGLDDVFTDRRLSRDLVEAQLARTATEVEPLLDAYACLATGGSSGLRGVFVWPLPALADYLLGVVRQSLARAGAGGPPPGGLALALVAAGSSVHVTRALPSLFSGDLVRITPVPAMLPLPEIVARLNQAQPMLLSGYASLLSVLADEQAAGRLAIQPASVSGTAEMFTPELMARVAAAFGAPVTNQFGSTEGLLGAAPPGESAIVLASDLAIVEAVDEHDRPVPPGVPSAKVLLTSLINPVQPLIRYEMTDQMRTLPPAPTHGHLRVEVQGRQDELFRYPGTTMHPAALRSVLVTTPAVGEYQVRQTAAGIAVTVVAGAALDAAALAGRLRQALAGAGPTDPQVAIDIVSQLERPPGTGKVRRFVPL